MPNSMLDLYEITREAHYTPGDSVKIKTTPVFAGYAPHLVDRAGHIGRVLYSVSEQKIIFQVFFRMDDDSTAEFFAGKDELILTPQEM